MSQEQSVEQKKITEEELKNGDAPENMKDYMSEEYYDKPPKEPSLISRFFKGLFNILTLRFLFNRKDKELEEEYPFEFDEDENVIEKIYGSGESAEMESSSSVSDKGESSSDKSGVADEKDEDKEEENSAEAERQM